MKLLSYNIWFSEKEREERLIILFEIIEKYNPDIICLQEVIPSTFDFINKYFRNRYNIFPQILTTRYGNIILSKYPIINYKIIELKSNMDRNITSINVQTEKDICEFITIHLESEFPKITTVPNSLKKEQFDETMKIFKENNISTFCLGDTNIRENENEYFVSEHCKDSWVEDGMIVGKKYTYNHLTNYHIKNKYKSRFDRIFYKSDNWTLEEFNIIGNDTEILASDHYGIIASFK